MSWDLTPLFASFDGEAYRAFRAPLAALGVDLAEPDFRHASREHVRQAARFARGAQRGKAERSCGWRGYAAPGPAI